MLATGDKPWIGFAQFETGLNSNYKLRNSVECIYTFNIYISK